MREKERREVNTVRASTRGDRARDEGDKRTLLCCCCLGDGPLVEVEREDRTMDASAKERNFVSV